MILEPPISDVRQVLTRCNAAPDKILQVVNDRLTISPGRLNGEPKEDVDMLARVLESAAFEARILNDRLPRNIHLLLALMKHPDLRVSSIFGRHPLDIDKVRES